MKKSESTPFSLAVNRTTWLLWVLISAATPILYSIAETALKKRVLSSDPYGDLISVGMLVLFVLIQFLVPFLHWFILRRVAHGLALLTWFGIALISIIIAVSLVFVSRDISWAVSYTILSAILLDLVKGKKQGQPRYLFLCAALIGFSLSCFIEYIYAVLDYQHLFRRTALNGLTWLERFEKLSYLGSIGAVWGASSGIFLALLFKKFGSKLTVSDCKKGQVISWRPALTLTFIIIIVPPTVTFISNTDIHSVIQTVKKELSSVPSVDSSTGKQVLDYAHNVDIKPPAYPVISFAPDSKSFVMIDSNRQISLVDVATGKVKPIAEPIGKLEHHERVWSPDGQFFILRSSGQKVSIPNSHYSASTSRFRVYGLPDYTLLAEYKTRRDGCLKHQRNYNQVSMAFANNKEVWVLCGQTTSRPKSGNLMALKLEIPSMKVLEQRVYGDNEIYSNVRGVHVLNDEVYVTQEGRTRASKTDSIVFTKLVHNQSSLILSGFTKPTMGGQLTFQYEQVKNGKISLFFCGDSSGVSDPAEKNPGILTVHGFCRTLIFDAGSGLFIKKVDDAKLYRLQTSSELVNSQNNLLIKAKWEVNSQSGQILVKDINERQIQTVETIAQRLIGLSPDNKWLVTYELDRGHLRLYQVDFSVI